MRIGAETKSRRVMQPPAERKPIKSLRSMQPRHLANMLFLAEQLALSANICTHSVADARPRNDLILAFSDALTYPTEARQ